jgi:hypothetical protein
MKARNAMRSPTVLLAVTLLTAAARAEESPPLVPGQRLRVTAAAPGRFTGVTVGHLVKVGPDSLTLVDAERGAVTELPVSSITRLEVSQGQRRHTRKGMLIGTAVGAVLAPLMWASLSEDPLGCGGPARPYRACTTGEKVALTALAFGVSAGGGAWLGHRRKSEEWSDAPVERLRVTVRPDRRGARVALTFSF